MHCRLKKKKMRFHSFFPIVLLLSFSVGKVYGKCRIKKYRIESRRQCRASCEQDNDCHGTLERCLCDGACGLSCFNPGTRCTVLEPILNGYTSATKHTIGGKVAYKCNSGYMLRGRRKRNCHADRHWYPRNVPICERIICSKPADPENGKVRVQFHIAKYLGAEIKYSCNFGFQLEGGDRGTCQADGTWSDNTNCTRLPVNPNCEFESYDYKTCGYSTEGTYWDWGRRMSFDGFYGYNLKSSNNMSKLVSPVIPMTWTNASTICLTFRFQVVGPYHSVTLSSTREHYHPDIDWHSLPQDRLYSWPQAFLTIAMDRPIQYQFRANSYGILLDDIKVYRKPCKDKCKGNPCQNNGLCVSRSIIYRCYCSESFKGEHCEIDRRCPIPSESRNNAKVVSGMKNRDVFLPGSSTTYLCIDGYKLHGEEYLNSVNVSVTPFCMEGSGSENSFWSPPLGEIACVPK